MAVEPEMATLSAVHLGRLKDEGGPAPRSRSNSASSTTPGSARPDRSNNTGRQRISLGGHPAHGQPGVGALRGHAECISAGVIPRPSRAAAFRETVACPILRRLGPGFLGLLAGCALPGASVADNNGATRPWSSEIVRVTFMTQAHLKGGAGPAVAGQM